MRRGILVCALAALLGSAAAGENRKEQEPKDFVIYDPQFVCSIRQVPGWKIDAQNAPKKSANIAVYRSTETLETAETLISLRILPKTGPNIEEDLKYEMQQYREQYAGMAFQDIGVSHARYNVYAKLIFLPHLLYVYAAYLDPGPGKPSIISIEMNTARRPATGEELRVYREILASFNLYKP